MATISITQIFTILQEKFGTETAENLTRFIEDKVKAEVDSKKEILATKEDVYTLHEKIAFTKAEIIKWMFIFWIGQIAATFGFILLFLKN